jgi:hypothetical protein
MNATRTATIALLTLLTAAGCSAAQTGSGVPGIAAPQQVVESSASTPDVGAAEGAVAGFAVTTELDSIEPQQAAGQVSASPDDVEPEDVSPATTVATPVQSTTTVPVAVPPATVPPVKVPVTKVPVTVPPVTVPPITIPPVIGQLPMPDCGVFGDIPDSASGVQTMLIDVDDDGDADTVTSYFVALGDSAGWRLRTQLDGGPMDDVAIEGVGPGAAEILGAMQVDHMVVDPATWTRELLVRAGANASGPNLAVYGLAADGCLFRFEDEGGAELIVPVHASIGTMSGLRCDAVSGHQFLVALEAEHDAGSIYSATETRFERSGVALVPSTILTSEIDADTEGDWLDQFGDLSCGDITL